jgi:polyisoprenoid-binding protein YceI
MKKSTLTIFAIAVIGLISSFKPDAKTSTYTVDTKSSKMIWKAEKVTGKHDGTIQLSSGKVMSDGKTITGGTFVIDMNTIKVVDITDAEYNAKLLGHLKSNDFFSVEEFKTSTFEITSTKKIEGERYQINGRLTIKEITNDVSFPATVKVTDKSIITVGTATVNRVKYGIKYGSGTVFTDIGDKAIMDDFQLEMNIIARK